MTHVSLRPAARPWTEATAAVAAVLDDVTRGFFWGGDTGLLFGRRVGTEPPGALQAQGETTVTPPRLAATTPRPAVGRKPPKNNKSEENRKSSVSTRGQMWHFYFGINKHSGGPYWAIILTLTCLSKHPTKPNTSNKRARIRMEAGHRCGTAA